MLMIYIFTSGQTTAEYTIPISICGIIVSFFVTLFLRFTPSYRALLRENSELRREVLNLSKMLRNGYCASPPPDLTDNKSLRTAKQSINERFLLPWKYKLSRYLPMQANEDQPNVIIQKGKDKKLYLYRRVCEPGEDTDG